MARTVTVGVEVLPLCDNPYPVVDRAIAAIKATGIKHQVCPMETVLEGTLDECLAAVRAAHEACFEAGVRKALTFVKISDGVDGSTIDDKMAKYR
ncbi:MAG: thiamine-binding protein [Anaerolineae bacterium]|nr:thiamine-binding protein [Anaerolineae bacterium]